MCGDQPENRVAYRMQKKIRKGMFISMTENNPVCRQRICNEINRCVWEVVRKASVQQGEYM